MSDANFTPNLGEYKSLQPFRFWCQKVLPLVYDDSLSYYELLCKVVDYLNKTMEDVETLHGDVTNLHKAYVELQGYVNNYFNNLDVQNEINNKLDTMAKDGTLATIFVPYLNAINSPIIVDSTAKMTDKNKIYLLSTNSHLYTYNNSLSAFTDTGIIYGQSNSQFIYDNDRNIPSHDFNDYVNCGGYFISISPTENDAVNAPFNLTYGDFVINNLSFPAGQKWVLQLVTMNNTAKYNHSVAYRWFNTETKEVTLNWKTMESNFSYSNIQNIASHDFNDFTECGGYWVTISKETSDAVNAPFGLKYGNFVVNNLSFPLAGSLWVMQIVSIDSSPIYNKSVAYRWFDCVNKTSPTGWRILKSNFNYSNIANIASHDFNDFTECGGYWVTISKETSDAVNAPFGLKYGNFVVNNLSFPLAGSLWVMQIVSIDNAPIYNKSVAYRWFDCVNKTSPTGWTLVNTCYNKSNSMYLMGDSITAGHPYEDNEAIRWFNPLKDIFNIDAGYRTGSGLLYKSGDTNGITMADAHNFSTNNFVCIFMGTNDYGNNIPLGEINDMYPANETVCGALNYILNKIRSDNTGCNIIGILPLNRKNGTKENNYAYGTANTAGYTLGELNSKISEIYKKYCCNVIDNEFSPINRFSLNNLLGDGLHPNEYGYRHLSQWLNAHIKALFNKTNF